MERNKEKWSQLWLRYEKKENYRDTELCKYYSVEGFKKNHSVIKNAIAEWKLGIGKMLGQVAEEAETCKEQKGLRIILTTDGRVKNSGYRISEKEGILKLEAVDESGVLYGVFHILREIAQNKVLVGYNELCNPANPIRIFNHWDNMDGSIERGYSGKSFFFEDAKIILNERTQDYARLVSSIGINAVVINNVNVLAEASWLVTDRYLKELSDIAELFYGYGIKLFLCIDFAASITVGGMETADPFAVENIHWWEKIVKNIYDKIPNFGGFMIKADSEGRPGPFTYGRTQADGANMFGDILKPYGGIVIWRCFVYNCKQDWRDHKTDRARAGYDNFIETDGNYRENVILQIKNGPMDFQIREPISPLLGGLKKTNQMLEVQIAQEYTGHQIDVCYLIPMFKEILNFKTGCCKENDLVADIISGTAFGQQNCGIAAVINTGNDKNWTGNDLAAANLYGFGRLAYNMNLTAEEIAEEWIRMTLSNDLEVVNKVKTILLQSRETYEKYTSPLGIGWMVTCHEHYGPSVDGYEYSPWGTYHRADHLGIGVDRTDKGTGYVRQYYEPNASMYNDIESCPEELLLFFHHVPYTYRLKTGKTLIQHIYDTHFEGVSEVEEMIASWESLRGKVEEEVYILVKTRFDMQLANAKEWRDQVNCYFYRKSGIGDEKNRRIY